MIERNSVFFINGGAGRVICSIPALEKYQEENPNDDFIIVCEGGMEFFKGHKTLHQKTFDWNHKNLFLDKIKDRNCFTPEPYRIWEYYNQKCNLAQAFDIAINNKGIRNLPKPTINLNSEEFYGGVEVINEVKEKTKKSKIIVFQPFGRGTIELKNLLIDQSGRSLTLDDTIEIIKRLQKDYGIILMTEFNIDAERNKLDPVAIPVNINLRKWAGIIAESDYFIGIDSVGQHIAYALDKRSSVLISSTFPINTSYPYDKNFNIIDIGENRRIYDPIRISYDEVSIHNNESLMQLNKDVIDHIVSSIKNHIENKKQISKDKNSD
jgi:ADP-heptose:LPS heptosyltransferase